MLQKPAMTKKSLASPGTVALIFAALLSAAVLGHAFPQDQQTSSMPGMDMSGMGDMSNMGPSMEAMAGHVLITPLRPKQPGDEEKAKAVVAKAKAMLQRYNDYRKPLAHAYFIPTPKL